MKFELLDEPECPHEGPGSTESEEEVDKSLHDDEDLLKDYEDETTPQAAFASVVDCIDRLFKIRTTVFAQPRSSTGIETGQESSSSGSNQISHRSKTTGTDSDGIKLADSLSFDSQPSISDPALNSMHGSKTADEDKNNAGAAGGSEAIV